MATPHIACDASEIAPHVIMPGDPKRADLIADLLLDQGRVVSSVRGINVHTGTHLKRPLTIMASGMGIPSLSIYASELFTQFGVERICRVGTCGAISSKVRVSDVVIATAAHTNSAVATFPIPGMNLSLSASYSMVAGAVNEANERRLTHHLGPVFTSDFFYSPRMDVVPALDEIGTLAVEMEAAGLYACALRAGKEALTVLTVSDHLKDGSTDLSANERESQFHNALATGVAALFA